jgi:ornithine--oxo-acid transaminase
MEPVTPPETARMTTSADQALSRQLMALEDRHGAHNYHPLPVVLCRGEGIRVEDVEGRSYVDCLSAYSAVNQGHCHPRIVAALVDQARKLTLTSRAFYTDRLGRFAQKVTQLFGYDKALMMNSGAEAVETALKLARRFGHEKKGIAPDTAKVVVCAGNFHGRTITIVSFSSDPESRCAYGPYTPGFVTVPYDDAAAVARAVADPAVCAFLVEPIQGEAGVVVPRDGYLADCARACRDHGVLFVADEIQTGLGRTGHLLAVEHDGVRPDVVILGKALSGGVYPVSCVLADDEVMLTIRPGQHGSTYGGNPLACAAATEALDVLLEEGLCERARVLGERFRAGLRELPAARVKLVRGRGLLNAIVIPPFEHGGRRHTAWDVCVALAGRGLLAKPTHDDVIRLAPPLVITEAEVDLCLGILRATLESLA